MQVETAFIIWPVTVAVGMVLRNLVFDRGTALPFIIVATLVTGVFLVGWRMLAAVAERRISPKSIKPGSLSNSGALFAQLGKRRHTTQLHHRRS